jgi:hypothetical protein
MGKKIHTFTGIKTGQKFKVIANVGSHCYPMDTILTFKKPGTSLATMSDIAVEVFGNSIRATEIELINYTIEEMMKEKQVLLEQIDDINLKIAFCLENGLKEFDDNVFKVMQALKVINSFTSDLDKAKEIATLLN